MIINMLEKDIKQEQKLIRYELKNKRAEFEKKRQSKFQVGKTDG